jgi:hypothetical protein
MGLDVESRFTEGPITIREGGSSAKVGQRTNKRGSVASVLFPHTVLSYQGRACSAP